MQFLLILAALPVVALLGGRTLLRAWFYPKPPPAAPVTNEPLDALLARLETSLRAHAPAVANSLRAGLSDERINALEAEEQLRLTDDVRALYRWHDGAEGAPGEFIPSHRFVPLADAVRARAQLRDQVRSLPFVQRVACQVFAGHRTGWLHVLDDGSGDGYFYDPARRRAPGSFFSNVNEINHYQFFPTLADFVAAVIECFETGAFRASTDGTGLRADFEKAWGIMGRYSVSNHR